MDATGVTLGEMLAGDAEFVVLQNQRMYAWKEDEIMQFADDIKYAYGEGKDDPTFQYFLGPMVFKKEGRRHIVVDGQQRLATVGVYVAVIRDILREKSEEDVRADGYLQYKRNGEERGRIILGERNREFYNKFIIRPERAKVRDELLKSKEYSKKNEPNYWLAFAYREFYEEIKKMMRGKNTDYVGLLDVISNMCRIIKIDVKTSEYAYRIFETLNARGMPLAYSDLIKNHVLEQCGPLDRNHIENQWEAILERVEAKNLGTYIRHFWIANYGVISKRKLYKEITSYLRKGVSEKKISMFVNELYEQSEIYEALQAPEQDRGFWWHDQDIIDDLSMLNEMNSEVVRIVLLIGKAKCRSNHTSYKQLVRMMLMFFFKSKVIGGTHATALEQALAKIAEKIRRTKSVDLIGVSGMLNVKEICPSVDSFKQKFADKHYNQKIGRYVLEQLEFHLKKSELRPASTITVEHIMPKARSKHWKHISDDEHRELLWSIGNLTLLSKDDNVIASSHSFKKKREIYDNSNIEITKSLKRYDVWDEEAIEERTKEFVELAAKIWVIRPNYK